MSDDDQEARHLDVAGYVLGSLTPAEQEAFEAHLATCGRCQADLDELDPLPVLLDLARPTPVPKAAQAPTPPPAARPTRSRRRILVAAGLAVALIAGVALGAVLTRPDQPRFSPPIALGAVDGATPDAAPAGTAAWRATSAGTEVRLDLTGLRATDTYYECLWISGQGVQSAGTFRATDDGTVRVDLVTAAARYPGWRLEIRAHTNGSAPDGTAVLEASA